MGTATNERTRTEDAKAAAQEAAGQAKEKLQGAADQTKEQASNMTGKAKGRVREQLDQRSTEFGERAGSTASDLRSVGDGLRQQGKDQPADLADRIADQVDQASSYLKDSGPDRLLQDAERFGRERPWAVIAGGLALGFVASRVLKTSSADRYHGTSRSTGTGKYPDATGTSYGAEGRSVGGYSTAGAQPASTVPRTPSPLDRVAERAERVQAATGGQSVSGADAAPTTPATPTTPSTTTHRDRENGLGSDGLS